MKWIKNHKLISFLLAIILISLVVLVGSVASGGRGNIFTNILNSVYSVVEKPVSKVAGASLIMCRVYFHINGFKVKTNN